MLAARYLAIATLGSAVACGFTPGEYEAPVRDARIDSTSTVDAPNPCKSTETCMTAFDLGTISGDTSTAALSTTGHLAAWIRVRVTEDATGVGGKPMRLQARLTSPATATYEVHAYVNVDEDQAECTEALGTPTQEGAVTQLRVEWGEGGVANASDDSRDVSIEIRPTSMSCAVNQPWTLEVTGNWL